MARQYLLRLEWPAPALWQNRRPHWSAARKAAREARKAAWAIAMNHGVSCHPNAVLEFEFHPPSKHKRDIQNMPATQKAAIDGIADAMGCDDSGFRPRWPETFAEPVKGGCVLVHIKPQEAEA